MKFLEKKIVFLIFLSEPNFGDLLILFDSVDETCDYLNNFQFRRGIFPWDETEWNLMLRFFTFHKSFNDETTSEAKFNSTLIKAPKQINWIWRDIYAFCDFRSRITALGMSRYVFAGQ